MISERIDHEEFDTSQAPCLVTSSTGGRDVYLMNFRGAKFLVYTEDKTKQLGQMIPAYTNSPQGTPAAEQPKYSLFNGVIEFNTN